MTHTTADKVKEIAVKSLSYFLRHDYFDHDEAFDNWAASEEGSRLVGELVEGWVSVKGAQKYIDWCNERIKYYESITLTERGRGHYEKLKECKDELLFFIKNERDERI